MKPPTIDLSNRWWALITWPLIPWKLIRAPINRFFVAENIYFSQGNEKTKEVAEGIFDNPTGERYVYVNEDYQCKWHIDENKYKCSKEIYLRNGYYNLSKIQLKSLFIKDIKSKDKKFIKDIKSKDKKLSDNRICVVYFPGNCSHGLNNIADVNNDNKQFEHEGFVMDAFLCDARGTGINYNGNTSIGYTEDLVVDDFVAMCKHKIETEYGGQSHRMILKTHSLGAGIGTKVACKLHEQGYPVMLWNGQSFDKAANVAVKTNDLPKKFNEFTITEKLTRNLLSKLINFGTNLLSWPLNSIKHWKKIPDLFKSYGVVKNKDDRQKDGVIPYYGSLHYALKKERTKLRNGLDDLLKILDHLKDSNSSNNELTFKDLFNRKKRNSMLKGNLSELKLKSKKSWFIRHCFSDIFKKELSELDEIYNYETSDTNPYENIMEMKLTDSDAIDAIKNRLYQIHNYKIDGKKFRDNMGGKSHDKPLRYLYSKPKHKEIEDAGCNANRFFVRTMAKKFKYIDRKVRFFKQKPKSNIYDEKKEKQRQLLQQRFGFELRH